MDIKISSEGMKSAGYVIGKAAKFVKGASSLQKQSLTRLGRDSILQTPVITSSAIGTDETIVIAKAIEKYIAAMAVSGFSLRTVDLSKNDDIAQYLKRYHDNGSIPSNISAASTFVMESASYIEDNTLQASESDILSCWNIITEQINMESLNDSYKPYEITKNIIQDKIEKLQIANESILDKDSKLNSFLDKMNSSMNTDNKNIALRNEEKTTKINSKGEKETSSSYKQIQSNTFNAIVKNDKLTALEPTMANVQFVMHGGQGDNKQFVQNVVLGFKAMVRIIRSDIMVANMIEAAKNSNIIFKFIKWTKGEFKLSLIHISEPTRH